MKIAIIVVRKKWNNAPYFLIEGIKKGIRELIFDKYDFKEIDFTFVKFTVHTPNELYINPETVKDYDVLLIPFWIGDKILNCNLYEIKKETNVKICLYTGQSAYCGEPFKSDFVKKEVYQGSLSDYKWRNFLSIDRFFVVKKYFSYEKEIEIGCGQFDEFISLDKSEYNGLIIDFCKQGWDEFIWEDFKEALPEIRKKCNVEIMQLGTYPFRLEGCAVHSDEIVFYKKLCYLYSKIKIWISMNESFGYSILENKYSGNMILVHENIEFPNFHLKSGKIISWNKNNIADKIKDYLDTFGKNTAKEMQEDFMQTSPELISWKDTVSRLCDELQQI